MTALVVITVQGRDKVLPVGELSGGGGASTPKTYHSWEKKRAGTDRMTHSPLAFLAACDTPSPSAGAVSGDLLVRKRS